jgi:ribosomal protein S18 acetylase RimI-like enzyme
VSRTPVPSGFRIESLSPQHNREGFSSGINALDTYLLKQVGQDVRRRVTSCFVLVADKENIAGYYTIAATSIILTDLPELMQRKLPLYPAVPATLMGRLAVDHRYRGRGFGALLLFDAFSRTLRSEIASYAFIVDAKDERAESFYEQYGFLRLQRGERRFFLPLSEIANLFT